MTESIPPLHRRYDPEDILEFHAARILVLLLVCGSGKSNAIEGRTKLAKLDFFLRYPQFLEVAHKRLGSSLASPYERRGSEVEAPMIRYRYGPWDPRQRSVTEFLESRGLVRLIGAKSERISLTSRGRRLAEELQGQPSYSPIVDRATAMRGNLAEWTGSELKQFIYEVFEEEVGALRLKSEIGPDASH